MAMTRGQIAEAREAQQQRKTEEREKRSARVNTIMEENGARSYGRADKAELERIVAEQKRGTGQRSQSKSPEMLALDRIRNAEHHEAVTTNALARAAGNPQPAEQREQHLNADGQPTIPRDVELADKFKRHQNPTDDFKMSSDDLNEYHITLVLQQQERSRALSDLTASERDAMATAAAERGDVAEYRRIRRFKP